MKTSYLEFNELSISSFASYLHIHLCPIPMIPPLISLFPIIKRIPTKRTTTTPAALKPLEKTPSMKQILARSALLLRQSLITAHNTIANRTLNLALHRTVNIALESSQGVDDAAVEDGDCAEGGAQPGLPFGFVDGDACE